MKEETHGKLITRTERARRKTMTYAELRRETAKSYGACVLRLGEKQDLSEAWTGNRGRVGGAAR